MKGDAERLVYCMQGAHYVIPVYQRKYDWRLDNCKQLFQDLIKTKSDNRETHFFGSIVSAHCDGEYNKFLLIDGQQRVTTISLLLLAMRNMILSGAVKAKNEDLAEEILDTYLINTHRRNEKRWKLRLTKEDHPAYEKLFQGEEDHVRGSNLTINYNFFCDQIKKEQISVDELFDAITRLEVINIVLSQGDNAQLIFQSLNSTGRALSEGDKIRNYILMNLSDTVQDIYYENYWSKIESYTRQTESDHDVSAFVRDYMSVKKQAIPAMDKVYRTFKVYVEEEKIPTEELLKDMLAYAKRYQILIRGKTSDSLLNACIYRLNRLETTITRPFFLEVLRMQEESTVTLEQVREIFLYTENYLFRRMICNLPTNSLNKIFLMLHREIIRFDGTANDYIEKFKFALLAKTDRGEFPRDDTFAEAFSERQIYQMNSKNKLYIFERLENAGTLEDKDIYRHCDNGTYTIEHIMPQHLTPAWADALGEDYEQIHELWLHRLANLTLTAYNSKYSNSSFEDKRDRKEGFRDSGLRMNTWVAQQTKWTLAELEARNSMLIEKALEIWPLPQTQYRPAEKQLDCYTLEDDVDLSGREILRFEYKGTSQPVSSWIIMQEQVLKILHDEDKSILSRLAHVKNIEDELDSYVSDNPADLRGALLIDDGIYLERNTSTSTKISMMRKFFKAYGATPEDLVFYLKDVDEDKTKGEAGTRFELRRKYWNFALNYIHDAHGEHGSFANVHTTKMHWLSGFFGISGFAISCVAKQNEARIDLVLSKAEKQKNKAAYDFLIAHKAEAEQKLGTPVEWMRSDETKSSFVVYRLPNVSINNENDWIQMAKFHAEWSKKFYDVFVPLLQQWNA